MDEVKATKESLLVTIREMTKQNAELLRRIDALTSRPSIGGHAAVRACLGFTAEEGPGREVRMRAQPQLPFRPDRLFVSSECAPHFLITDVRIGMDSSFISSDPIPARLFAVDNLHQLREVDCDDKFSALIPTTYDTAIPGVLVSVVAHRIVDDSDMPFECVMTGDVLQWDTNDPWPFGPLTRASSKN